MSGVLIAVVALAGFLFLCGLLLSLALARAAAQSDQVERGAFRRGPSAHPQGRRRAGSGARPLHERSAFGSQKPADQARRM